jgi:hypothetical protein
VLALLRYATSLGVDHREARRSPGCRSSRRAPAGRALDRRRRATAVILAVTLALTIDLAEAAEALREEPRGDSASPVEVSVDVLNGSGDINYTRRVATRVGSYGYRIQHVTKANRFDYPETTVYYEPGGATLADRLATQIGCGTPKPLPGGKNPRRLVVIVGPAHATC